MARDEVWRLVADRLEREAAAIEETVRLPDGTLPDPADGRALAARLARGHWRDAGLARSLRDAAVELAGSGAAADDAERRLSTSSLRVQTWLLARQLEHEAAVDAAVAELAATGADGDERAHLVARSAYALGRARGIRMATELWAAASSAGRPDPGIGLTGVPLR